MAHAPEAAAGSATIRVTVAYSPAPREVDVCELELPPGARAGDAVEASGLRERHALPAADALMLGIWGRPCDATQALREQDRVEVYRPLRVDPKEARRRRQQQQREAAKGRARQRRRRAAGLTCSRRR